MAKKVVDVPAENMRKTVLAARSDIVNDYILTGRAYPIQRIFSHVGMRPIKADGSADAGALKEILRRKSITIKWNKATSTASLETNAPSGLPQVAFFPVLVQGQRLRIGMTLVPGIRGTAKVSKGRLLVELATPLPVTFYGTLDGQAIEPQLLQGFDATDNGLRVTLAAARDHGIVLEFHMDFGRSAFLFNMERRFGLLGAFFSRVADEAQTDDPCEIVTKDILEGPPPGDGQDVMHAPRGTTYEVISSSEISKPAIVECGYNDLSIPVQGVFKRENRKYTEWGDDGKAKNVWTEAVDVFIRCRNADTGL